MKVSQAGSAGLKLSRNYSFYQSNESSRKCKTNHLAIAIESRLKTPPIKTPHHTTLGHTYNLANTSGPRSTRTTALSTLLEPKSERQTEGSSSRQKYASNRLKNKNASHSTQRSFLVKPFSPSQCMLPSIHPSRLACLPEETETQTKHHPSDRR